MTITELLERKKKLEVELQDIVEQFQNETGVGVESINMRNVTVETWGSLKPLVFSASVEINLRI